MNYLQNEKLFFNMWQGSTWNGSSISDHLPDDFTRYTKHIDYSVDDEPYRMFIAYVHLDDRELVMIRFTVPGRFSLKIFYKLVRRKHPSGMPLNAEVDFSQILNHVLEISEGITENQVAHHFMIASIMMVGGEA